LAASQPFRMELARAGERYLGRDGLTDSSRTICRFFLDHAFDGRIMIALAFGLPPILIAALIIVKMRPSKNPRPTEQPDPELTRITTLGLFSAAGAAPFATLFLLLEMIGVGLIAKITRTAKALRLNLLLERALRAVN
ncbi:MAG TPA: hypothetical protein VGB88_15305, partial [Alphaproteobacteria bacterium]